MAIDLPFRRRAVRTLTNDSGCYVLCDLDQVPIYVGQSIDGIRSRANRHLTSARVPDSQLESEEMLRVD
jgi:excinuclease UvrABC nuclease subunit